MRVSNNHYKLSIITQFFPKYSSVIIVPCRGISIQTRITISFWRVHHDNRLILVHIPMIIFFPLPLVSSVISVHFSMHIPSFWRLNQMRRFLPQANILHSNTKISKWRGCCENKHEWYRYPLDFRNRLGDSFIKYAQNIHKIFRSFISCPQFRFHASDNIDLIRFSFYSLN